MSIDINIFLNDIKRAAIEAVKAEKPFAFSLGRVTSTIPLEVWIDQKMRLTSSHLILTNAVRNFTVLVDDEPKKVSLELKLGEQVILLRVDGGQKYIILDRVEAPNDTADK